jgi:hypothetical protein
MEEALARSPLSLSGALDDRLAGPSSQVGGPCHLTLEVTPQA